MVRNPSAHGRQADIVGKFSANLRALALERRRARKFSGIAFAIPPPGLSNIPRMVGYLRVTRDTPNRPAALSEPAG
jgi:hypothetical protein